MSSDSRVLPYMSIVIPCYNERATIQALLESIYAQTYPRENLEVVVVDGLSTDGTRGIIESFQRERADLHIQVIDNPKQIIPEALNLGIRAAQGNIIVRLDAHCTVAKDYLDLVAAKLETTDAACLGPRMFMKPVNTPIARSIAAALSTPFGPGTSGFRFSDKEGEADTMNFGIYRRWVFEKAGYFDPQLLSNEDYDLHYRIRQTGNRILYVPALAVFYQPRENYAALWKQYWRYGFWKSQMSKKDWRSLRVRHLVAPGWVLALIGGLAGAIVVPALLPLWAGMIILYLLAGSIFAIRQALKTNEWQIVPLIVFTFMILHAAWGAAFWVGWLTSPTTGST
jgi:glycosyltransferase involved in cell wall biosynthesis